MEMANGWGVIHRSSRVRIGVEAEKRAAPAAAEEKDEETKQNYRILLGLDFPCKFCDLLIN